MEKHRKRKGLERVYVVDKLNAGNPKSKKSYSVKRETHLLVIDVPPTGSEMFISQLYEVIYWYVASIVNIT